MGTCEQDDFAIDDDRLVGLTTALLPLLSCRDDDAGVAVVGNRTKFSSTPQIAGLGGLDGFESKPTWSPGSLRWLLFLRKVPMVFMIRVRTALFVLRLESEFCGDVYE